ncbi:MAG: hypothetical protein KJ066_19415 [Acidobacteria bacterium]|nr:hypothetical protein [Acidobacteriota bacterium]
MEIVVWLLAAGVILLALAVLLRSSHRRQTDWQRIVRQRTAYAKAQRELRVRRGGRA